MPELGPYGSVRGARGNSRPYRDPRPEGDVWASQLPHCESFIRACSWPSHAGDIYLTRAMELSAATGTEGGAKQASPPSIGLYRINPMNASTL